MRSAFGLQGQKCSACSRVYVDRSVAERFIDLLVEKSKALVVGDPTLRGVYVGPVIDEAAVNASKMRCSAPSATAGSCSAENV